MSQRATLKLNHRLWNPKWFSVKVTCEGPKNFTVPPPSSICCSYITPRCLSKLEKTSSVSDLKLSSVWHTAQRTTSISKLDGSFVRSAYVRSIWKRERKNKIQGGCQSSPGPCVPPVHHTHLIIRGASHSAVVFIIPPSYATCSTVSLSIIICQHLSPPGLQSGLQAALQVAPAPVDHLSV